MNTSKENTGTMKKALVIGVLSSVTTGISALMGGTMTLYADFCRRFLEFLATLVSFFTYCWVGKNSQISKEIHIKVQRRACITTGLAMSCSSILLIFVSIAGFSTEPYEGNVIPGFIIAVLGVILNFYFYVSYRRALAKQSDPIIHSQCMMYRAKTGVDSCVVLTLGCILFVPNWTLLPWIDLGCTLIVACCLFIEGIKNIVHK